MKPITREWVKKAEDDFKVPSQILRCVSPCGQRIPVDYTSTLPEGLPRRESPSH